MQFFTLILESGNIERPAAQFDHVGGAERKRTLIDEPYKRKRVCSTRAETRRRTDGKLSTVRQVSDSHQNDMSD